MRSLIRFSKALDSGDLNDILLAAESLEVAEDCEWQNSILALFYRFLRIGKMPRFVAENVGQILMGHLLPSNRLEICSKILLQQIPFLTQLSAENILELSKENLKLSEKQCREICEKIENPEKEAENAENIGATLKVLRNSGFIERRKLAILLHSHLEFFFPIFRKNFEIPEIFLIELAEFDPANPISEICSNQEASTSLIPQCFSAEFRAETGILRFSEFLSSWSLYRDEDAQKYYTVFEKYCGDLRRDAEIFEEKKKWIGILADFWYSGFRMSNGLDIQKTQKMIGLFKNTCQQFFDLQNRPLFIKRILKRIQEKKTTQIGYEPQIVAVLIDEFRKNIREKEFENELGEFWHQINSIKYDNIYNATSFYSALFILAKSQAIFKINKSLCSTVLNQIIEPIHQQIVDFKNLKKSENEKDEADNLGEEMFEYLIFTLKDAQNYIRLFIE
ncbi:unnamed protein product [Caenorhabditis angaria]|uniref:Uncharacterized protein n=1 Tax=Caenorhabditis angaria TaxID=860376 RepID=A0A9P1MVA1_9PELO|nr:unnamed protein product [Caenorhabditis angaria]